MRVVLLLLLSIPLALFWILSSDAFAPRREAGILGEQSPSLMQQARALFQEEGRSFLPPPVAALPPEPANPAPAPAEARAAEQAAETVKVANTGGLGAILRAEPPRGQQVGALLDGMVLQVLERSQIGGDEWLRVRTLDNKEGWIYGPLVAPAQ